MAKTMPKKTAATKPKMGRHVGPPKDEERRCTFVRRDGSRCKQYRMAGLTVCRAHGGRLPGPAKKHKMAVLVEKMTKHGYGTRPVPDDHIGANPITGYLWELRRTAGNIITAEEYIGALDPEELIWGKTKYESKDAALTYSADGNPLDNSYELTVEEAKAHMWVNIYMVERKHYATLLSMGIKAGLEEKRLRMQEQLVIRLNGGITNIISNLGHDPADPAIRRMIRDELINLEEPDEIALELE